MSIPASGTTAYTSGYVIDSKAQNLVVRYKNATSAPTAVCAACTPVNAFAIPTPNAEALSSAAQEDAAHLKWANIKNSGFVNAIVPFPIQMFDSREGLANDSQAEANAAFGADKIPSAGVMSLVDIDVANLRLFLSGAFDGQFPQGTAFASAKKETLRAKHIPSANGWVVYFSDRRGDFDFDGAYDMEDIFPNGWLEANEGLNRNKRLEKDFGREAPTFATAVARGQAATADHLYYRRGVRLINAAILPGNYNKITPDDTKGFTFASENGVYVKGNYNATGAAVS